MSYMQDMVFQDRVLALAVSDMRFLRKMSDLMSSKDFASKERTPETWAREQIAAMAIKWWRKYREPIGGMLRVEALDFIRANRKEIGKKYSQTLLELCTHINDPKLQVAPGAIEEKYRAYKRRQTMRNAIAEFTALQMRGELTVDTWMEVSRSATAKLADTIKATDYLTTVERRIQQREVDKELRYPHLMIDCLDAAIRTIPRGQIGLWLGKYKRGKSTALVHTAQAHAFQGYSVLYFTLEDPESVVTDRLDASLMGIPLIELADRPNRIRRRWHRVKELLRASIKTVDGTGGGWTVERMAEKWESERLRGFTADVVIVDYDDKIEPPVRYKGDSAVRFQSKDVYQALGDWAARDRLYMWTAAQAKRLRDGTMIVTGDDAAEDINKLRAVGLCLGIGDGPKELNLGDNGRYIYVAAHRFGTSMIGWPIKCDLDKAIFYDRIASIQINEQWGQMRGPIRPV